MRHLAALIVAALAALALAACGGEPIALAAVPALPAASELAPGQHPLADNLAETMRGSAGGRGAEVRIYGLPPGTGLEEARQHYAGALPGEGWRPVAELETAGESFSTIGWQRGAGSDEQVLTLGYLPASHAQPPALIVALYSSQR
jgi:hypothetical protein